MFYTIYKITNNLSGKTYIGKHQTKDLQDGYMGSGKLIKAAIKKHGIENFTKEILHVFNSEEEMNQAEKDLVVIGEESYNLCEGGKGGWSFVNRSGLGYNYIKTTETETVRKNKIAVAYKNPILKNRNKQQLNDILPLGLEAIRNKYPLGIFYGRKHTEDTKQKLSIAHIGKHDGTLNSQYGTCWITNGTENKKIKKDDLDNWISLGYYKGRKSS